MMSAPEKTQEPSEIELLLPWHAAGTLNRDDAERVEAALASDVELRRRFHLAREERAETIHLNETLGAPSARAIERVMTRIEAEGEGRSPRRVSFGLASWLGLWVARQSPGVLAWSAAAAVVVIVLQAGLLAGVYVERGRSVGYQTASVDGPTAPGVKYALVGFLPKGSAAEIAAFLETHGLKIIDGPHPGGLFKVRVGPAEMSRTELEARIKQLQQDSTIVRMAVMTD